jgi:hypothetical protein
MAQGKPTITQRGPVVPAIVVTATRTAAQRTRQRGA